MNNNQSSNNTNNINKVPNNGGATTPSLSGVNKVDANHQSLATANSRKGNLGKRENPVSSPSLPRANAQSLNAAMPTKNANNRGMNPRQQAAREMNPLRRRQQAANVGKMGAKALGAVNPLLGLAAKGANSLMNGRQANKANRPSDIGSSSKSSSSKIDENGNNGEDATNEKDSEEEYNKQTGNITFAATKKVVIKLAIIVPIITISVFLFVALIGEIAENKTSSFVLSELVKEEREQLVDEIVGTGDLMSPDSLSSDAIPQEYQERLRILGNNFTSDIKCSGKECESSPEFLYYLKVADLAIRYRQKYGVDLNLFLLVATDLYKYGTEEEGMKANIGGYDKDKVTDLSTPSTLDWDTDYKHLSGYSYLDYDDSTYDLNILAKNMVTKKTTQICSTGGSQTDKDIEDEYFEPGGEKRMACEGDVSVSSTYSLDLDKYDEFLLEYIDKKFFTSYLRGNSMAEVMINLAVAQLEGPSAYGGGIYKDYMGWGSNSGAAWCAAFVSWVVGNTEYNGTKLSSLLPVKYGVVADWANYLYNSDDSNLKFYWNDNTSAYKGKNGSGNYTPKPGDMIFFDWECTWDGSMPMQYSIVDHIGLVQKMDGNQIVTIEGNWGNSVYERRIDLNSCIVVGFGSWYK